MGIARYSNYMNADTLEQARSWSSAEVSERLRGARRLLGDAGAHYVIDEPSELLGVVDHINGRLRAGERP